MTSRVIDSVTPLTAEHGPGKCSALHCVETLYSPAKLPLAVPIFSAGLNDYDQSAVWRQITCDF